MDEYTKRWHFYSWMERREEKAKFMKDLGSFVGSFYNPEMAKKIKDMENAKHIEVSEDAFDMATKIVEGSIETRKEKYKNIPNRRRQRRKISIIR